MTDIFDYIIVGGGTAAGIIAWRLGEAGHSVCVLEAGPEDRHPYIHIPAGFNKTLHDPKLTWKLGTEPEPGGVNRSIAYTLGKTLGGSSSINGMIYNRGQSADFDSWEKLGNVGWSYADVLPYFRRTEKREGLDVDPAYRGTEGRLKVINARWPNALEDAFVESAQACGHPFNADHNGARQEGTGWYQSSINLGWRVSTATAFLRPARKLFNVDIRTHAQVRLISSEGKRATSVVYMSSSDDKTVKARREVIVAAGAINSPKLLQLSGIGPGTLLQEHGVTVLHDLPGVGENFRDHFGPRIVMRAKPGVDSINLHVKGFPLIKQVVRWLFKQPSILATSPARAFAFGKSDPAFDNPDYVIMFAPASFKGGLVGVLDDFPGLSCGAWPMRPESKGYVRITSSDPHMLPKVNPRYLTQEADQLVQLAAIRAGRKILATNPLSSMLEEELFPGLDCNSDDELLDFVRGNGATSFHFVGSCKMGPSNDAMAVVDPQLRVHGIEGLRVIDASIMPVIPSANTAASTMMIAEKGSDMILQDALQAK